MNKSHLISYVAGELQTSKLQAARLVDTVLDGIKQGLQADKTVTITGFGTFEVKDRKARIGRNPHTGAPINIEAGRRVGFRVGKALKESV
ncbi:MAG: HU family DNA-binding protein [bacterium]|nr:HU family DNA-binding protein [bacterium]